MTSSFSCSCLFRLSNPILRFAVNLEVASKPKRLKDPAEVQISHVDRRSMFACAKE